MLPELRRHRGYTLVELMMVLAIAAVLGTLALPAFGGLLGRTREGAAVTELQASLNQARIEAVNRNLHVVVCPSGGGDDCTRTSAWQRGWIAFTDLDRNGRRSGREPLLARGTAPAGVGIVASAGRQRVNFQPDGSATGTNLTLTVCSQAAGAAGARTVVVSQVGRIRHGSASPAAAGTCLAAID